MSRRTKSFKTRSGRVFEVSCDHLGDDLIVEKIFRELFIQPNCFQISLDRHPHGVVDLLVEVKEIKRGWTIPDYSFKLLNEKGGIENGEWCPKNERTSIFFPASDVFNGVTFAISGRGQRWYKKEILRPFLNLSGGTVAPTIKPSVDFLLLARSNLSQENAKIEYAKKHGIQIISPRELMSIWFSEFQRTHAAQLDALFQKRKPGKGLALVSVQSLKKSSQNRNGSW